MAQPQPQPLQPLQASPPASTLPAITTTPRQQDVVQNPLANGSGSVASESGETNTNVKGKAKKANESGQFTYLFRVFKYTDRNSWYLNAVAILCTVGSGTTLPLMDIVFGRFVTIFNDFQIGRLSPAEFRSQVNTFTLYYVYLFVAKFVLTYIWTLLLAITATRTTKALRVDFLRQTLRQEIAFFESPATNSISGQVTTNGNLVNQGISERLGLIVQASAMFVAAFIVAFAIHWKLTLIILSIVPVNLVVTAVTVVIDVVYENRILGIYAQGGSIAQEVFASIRTVHAFWAFPRLSKKFEENLAEAKKVGMKKSPVLAVMFAVEFFCIYCGYALAFWQGIRMFARGEIEEPGVIVTVIFAVVVAAQALTQVAPQFMHISKAAAAAQELFQTLERVPQIDSLSDEGIKLDHIDGTITLSNLRFSYPTRPDVPVLKDLSLSIPANQTTALVGTSGSGKSTIVGLIERWYSPLGGQILLDGHDIRELNIQWLRSNIRLVQQEPTLFNGSIFQNVSYGLTGTEMENLPEQEKRRLVEDACRSAFAHEFIEKLPEGYDTKIGERGASLSGGQKQRVVIARSIISNPKVLLLDEATSALDPAAEKIVQKALNNAAVGRTMVVIAHRLSTIRDAHNIVVMSQGEAIEQGTHSELMELGGMYSRLVRTQHLGSKEKGNEDASDTEDEAKESVIAQRVSTAISEQQQQQQQHAQPLSTEALEAGGLGKPNYGLIKCLFLVFKEQKAIWHPSFWMVIGCLIGGATYPAVAVLFSRTMVVFEMQGSEMAERGDFWALMFFVVALGNLVAYALLGVVGNVVSQAVIKYYRSDVFNNTMRQEMAFFDDPNNTTGALVSRLSSEPTNLQELVSLNIALLLINVVNLVSSCILAIAVGWKLGLVLVFGAMPPIVFCGYLRIRLEFRLDTDTAARFASSSGLAAEAVMAIRTVSSLTLEKEILRRYLESLVGISERAVGDLGWRMLWYALSQSISFLAMALGFWYGGRLMSTGEYSSMQFYTVFIAVIFSGESAAMFFQYSTSITKARTSANYIFQLRQHLRESANHDKTDSSDDDNEKPTEGAGVVCEDLEFAYPQRPHLKVLKGISIKIEPGQFVAAVGASGCGKTTVISLLERFYDPTNGSINFGGRPIRSMSKQSYRRNIALVQQEPVLYQGSIRDNIALGGAPEGEHIDPSEEQIEEACRQANISDFIASLPEGLNTSCGAQGLQLSGGQRQRIAIARALVRRPKLLLLDEATSALDTESEAVVKEALDQAAEGRTTVAVAHRLSTVREADIIFVFSHGRIVESGRHEQLLQKKGVYYEMCLGQSLDRAV